jgi:hypothetical protein
MPIGMVVIPRDVARAFPVPHGTGDKVIRSPSAICGFLGSEFRTSKTRVSPPKTTIIFSFEPENTRSLRNSL